MKIPQPYFKQSHKCWYVNIAGKTHRLHPSEKEAFEIYSDLMADKGLREGNSGKAYSVRDILKLFLDWLARNRESKTLAWYERHILDGETGLVGFRSYLPATLLVRDLKPYHLDNWLEARHSESGDTTKAGAITAIVRVFNWAKKQGYIKENPLAGFPKPQRTSRGEEAYLTPDQWKKLVATIDEGQKSKEVEPFMDYVTVMRETGCRPQEIKIVEARHLDLERKQWVFEKKKSKGKKEKRVVLLGDRACEICRRLALKHPSGPMFRNSDGKPWTNSAINGRYIRLSKKLGFKIFAYAVRHIFATEALIAGCDPVTVARLMGHKDLKMIMEVYSHVAQDTGHMEEARKKAMNRIAS